jgi:hypothetical protein
MSPAGYEAMANAVDLSLFGIGKPGHTAKAVTRK